MASHPVAPTTSTAPVNTAHAISKPAKTPANPPPPVSKDTVTISNAAKTAVQHAAETAEKPKEAQSGNQQANQAPVVRAQKATGMS